MKRLRRRTIIALVLAGALAARGAVLLLPADREGQ